jgi:hypothetical protein
VSEVSDTIRPMPPKEVDELMDALLLWCKAERGRSRDLAAEIGVEPQVLSNWLYKRKRPSLDYWFALVAFAKRKRIIRR